MMDMKSGIFLIIVSTVWCQTRQPYYGKLIGTFENTLHGLAGTVYAANRHTFIIQGFSYDGTAPAAHFWVGHTEKPDRHGTLLPFQNNTMPLRRFINRDVMVVLPEGRTVLDFMYFGVWCASALQDFGHVKIPASFEAPRPLFVKSLTRLGHSVSSAGVVINDTKTIFIEKLTYDGRGPDAFFFVGKGSKPNQQGTKVPDEAGSILKMHAYREEDVTLTLPGDLTFHDVDWFSLYCISYKENFGHTAIPKNLNVPPGNLLKYTSDDTMFENCEELFAGKMQVHWKIEESNIIFKLTGEINDKEYLAFGLSGNQNSVEMVNSDVTVVFFDQKLQEAKAVDYFLTSKAQCSIQDGACPDTELGGTDSVTLIGWKRMDGMLSVTYMKPISSDHETDISFKPLSAQVIVAAIGPLNSQQETAKHHTVTRETIRYTFASHPPVHNCQVSRIDMVTQAPVVSGWGPFKLVNTDIFKAQIGPTGEERGYTYITGYQAWGYAWWINGLLVPELILVRGKEYTFIVEGGQDPNSLASYHPFYITNNPEGGGAQFADRLGSPEHMIYAGATKTANGVWNPTAAGRLCELKTKSGFDMTKVSTFEEYKETLESECKEGSPATFVFKPDKNTPDTLYYQCFTHRNFGWKITVTGGEEKGGEEKGGAEKDGAVKVHQGYFTVGLTVVIICTSFLTDMS